MTCFQDPFSLIMLEKIVYQQDKIKPSVINGGLQYLFHVFFGFIQPVTAMAGDATEPNLAFSF